MRNLIYMYRMLMPFLYIGASVYLLAAPGKYDTDLYVMVAAVIGLYGVYRLVSRFDFFRKASRGAGE